MEGPMTSTISAHDASVKERILVNLLLAHPPTRIADGRFGINPVWIQRHLRSYMYSQIFGASPLYWGRSTAAFAQNLMWAIFCWVMAFMAAVSTTSEFRLLYRGGYRLPGDLIKCQKATSKGQRQCGSDSLASEDLESSPVEVDHPYPVSRRNL